jgi:hypothetical protein
VLLRRDGRRARRQAHPQLAKILRDNGLQPISGKGEDHGEERWYARRFRRPAVSKPSGAKDGKALS